MATTRALLTAPTLLAIALAISVLSTGGCRPSGGAGTWRFGNRTYSYTPDQLVGRWKSHDQVIEFQADGTLVWKSVPGRWSIQSDRSLRAVTPMSTTGSGIQTSFKYSVEGDTLTLLDNGTGTFTEYTRVRD